MLSRTFIGLTVLCTVASLVSWQLLAANSVQAQGAVVLAPVEAFDKIGDPKRRSLALFQEAGKVITHPRCLNCHPPDNTPRQGEDMRVHNPPVQRGPTGSGTPAMRCSTCHGKANYDAARIPGHGRWRLAPIEMAWLGQTLGAICEQIKDPQRNGGKTLEQIVNHMARDSLVGWGWHPGDGREPAPGTQEQFGELIKAWAETGAYCPKS
jgi:hypothetical protein